MEVPAGRRRESGGLGGLSETWIRPIGRPADDEDGRRAMRRSGDRNLTGMGHVMKCP